MFYINIIFLLSACKIFIYLLTMQCVCMVNEEFMFCFIPNELDLNLNLDHFTNSLEYSLMLVVHLPPMAHWSYSLWKLSPLFKYIGKSSWLVSIFSDINSNFVASTYWVCSYSSMSAIWRVWCDKFMRQQFWPF